jgi:hypothetical protein
VLYQPVDVVPRASQLALLNLDSSVERDDVRGLPCRLSLTVSPVAPAPKASLLTGREPRSEEVSGASNPLCVEAAAGSRCQGNPAACRS